LKWLLMEKNLATEERMTKAFKKIGFEGVNGMCALKKKRRKVVRRSYVLYLIGGTRYGGFGEGERGGAKSRPPRKRGRIS